MTGSDRPNPPKEPDESAHQGPHEGSEDDLPRAMGPRDEPAPLPPVRYEGDAVGRSTDPLVSGSGPGAGLDLPSQPTTMDRLVAVSGPLALITFFLIGFGLGAWYVAWLVFLVPGALRAWNRPR